MDVVGEVAHLRRHLHRELAVVAPLDLPQPRGVARHQVGELAHQLAALRGRELAQGPSSAWRAAATARFTSSALPRAIRAQGWLVYGSSVGVVARGGRRFHAGDVVAVGRQAGGVGHAQATFLKMALMSQWPVVGVGTSCTGTWISVGLPQASASFSAPSSWPAC